MREIRRQGQGMPVVALRVRTGQRSGPRITRDARYHDTFIDYVDNVFWTCYMEAICGGGRLP
jgi:hypothetical protein